MTASPTIGRFDWFWGLFKTGPRIDRMDGDWDIPWVLILLIGGAVCFVIWCWNAANSPAQHDKKKPDVPIGSSPSKQTKVDQKNPVQTQTAQPVQLKKPLQRVRNPMTGKMERKPVPNQKDERGNPRNTENSARQDGNAKLSFCSFCGQKVSNPEAKFCTGCGKALS